MGFLGMSGKTWKKIGKVALKAAPIVAAPFTGGASLLALGAGTGALSGAMGGGGWKGALLGGALGAIPGGGAGGAAAGGVAKAGLKEVAKGVAKGAATNFAAGTATGLATGQGLKHSLVGGAQAAGSGGIGTGGLAQAAKTVGKNVATNVGGHYAAKGLQKAGVPGAIAQQGGNVFSNYLGNQFNKPTVGPSSLTQQGVGFGASGRPDAGGATFGTVKPTGGGVKGAVKGAATAGLGALATGVANRTGGTGTTGTIPTGTHPIPTSTSVPGGNQIPAGRNPIPTTTSQIPRTTGQAPTTTAPATQQQQQQTQDPNKPASWAQRYGPIATQIGGAVVGGIVGAQSQKNAMKRSPEEQAALTGAQGAAGQLGRFGGQAWQKGNELQQAPGQYFQTLLSGNRAAMSQAIAGPAAQITGNYRGAQRALDQSGVRGAARDVAVGDLNRDRVSKIAGLTTGMQPYAAEQLTSMGQQQQALAPGMIANAGQLHSGLLGQGAGNREYARREGAETAKAVGGLVREVGEVAFKPGQKPATPEPKKEGGTPTAPTAPAPAVPAGGGVAVPPSTFPNPKVQVPPFGTPRPPATRPPATGYPSGNIPLPNFGYY